jgi:hypothetical protein
VIGDREAANPAGGREPAKEAFGEDAAGKPTRDHAQA